MIPLGSLGINGPQLSKLIGSHGLLSLNGLEDGGGLIERIAVAMPSPSSRFVAVGGGIVSGGGRGIDIVISMESAGGFVVGGFIIGKFGSGFVKIHVGGEEVILWSKIFESDGWAIEWTTRLEIEVVGESELALRLGTAVKRTARRKMVVVIGKRHRSGSGKRERVAWSCNCNVWKLKRKDQGKNVEINIYLSLSIVFFFNSSGSCFVDVYNTKPGHTVRLPLHLPSFLVVSSSSSSSFLPLLLPILRFFGHIDSHTTTPFPPEIMISTNQPTYCLILCKFGNCVSLCPLSFQF